MGNRRRVEAKEKAIVGKQRDLDGAMNGLSLTTEKAEEQKDDEEKD